MPALTKSSSASLPSFRNLLASWGIFFSYNQFFVISWQFSILHLMRTVDIVQFPQQSTFDISSTSKSLICLKAVFGPLKQCRILHGCVISVVDAGGSPTTMFIFSNFFGLICSNLHRLTIRLKLSHCIRIETENTFTLPYSSKSNGLF